MKQNSTMVENGHSYKIRKISRARITEGQSFKAVLQRIRRLYSTPSRHNKGAPYNGYDVAGAFMCFCNNVRANEAPGCMRHPTAGDVARCLIEQFGWDGASAKDVALRLCNLCDNSAPGLAWAYLMERTNGIASSH